MTAFTRSLNPAVRQAARGLAEARDEQILRAVAMVDAMPERGEADQIIAPLRARLARLRPARPLRFARLLFLPLDPLIVPAARWRPDQPAIPRTIIPALAAAVEEGCVPMARTVMAMIEGHTTDDHALIEAAGALAWTAAAAFLLGTPPLLDRNATGLTPRMHEILARRIGAVLGQADRLQALASDAAQGLTPPEEGSIQALLRAALEHEPAVQAMVIALLLARVPEAGPVLTRAAAAPGDVLLRQAGESAAAFLLDQLEAPGGVEAQPGGQDLTRAAAAVRRLITLLNVLDGGMAPPGMAPPGRRDRPRALRDRVGASAEALFTERLTVDFLEPLRARAPGAGPEQDWALEAAARGLRALEIEARRAGGGKIYDTLLDQAAGTVRVLTTQGVLARTSGRRLMEILAGPEVALAVFPPEA